MINEHMLTFAHGQIEIWYFALQYRFATHKRESSLTVVSERE
jgi:hypothetical protein